MSNGFNWDKLRKTKQNAKHREDRLEALSEGKPIKIRGRWVLVAGSPVRGEGKVAAEAQREIKSLPLAPEAMRAAKQIERRKKKLGQRKQAEAARAAERTKLKAARANAPEAQPLPAAYVDARFATRDAVSTWPRKFVIVSAYCSDDTHSYEDNEQADMRLGSELKQRCGWLRRIVRFSPQMGHSEPSWACTLLLGEACEVGRRYGQEAVYRVRREELSVIRCSDPTNIIGIGSFRERLGTAPRGNLELDLASRPK